MNKFFGIFENMDNRSRDCILEIVGIFVAVIACFIGVFFAFHMWNMDFYGPLVWVSEGDGGMANIKNVIQGHFYEYQRAAAPFGTSYYANDYILQYIFLYLIGIITKNVAFASNIFWLLTYVLTAVTSYLFIRRMKCEYMIAVFGSTVYTFLPYHYFRYDHIWLMGCYGIPLACWLIADVLKSPYPGEWNLSKKQKISIEVSFCILIGLNGLYYAFFSGILIIFAGILRLIDEKRWDGIVLAIEFSVIIMALSVFFIAVIPYIFDGGETFAQMQATRRVQNVIRYGLRIFAMLFPIPGHRIPFLRNFTAKYYTDLEVVDEYAWEPMGLLMSCGFLISLFVVFFREKIKELPDNIWRISQINLFTVLLAVTGGFSVFIGIFVTHDVRCYCRMGVFIALYSDLVICILLEKIFRKYSIKRIFQLIGCTMLMIVAVFDQTSNDFAQYHQFDMAHNVYDRSVSDINTAYYSEKDFVDKVEEFLGEDKAVWMYTSMNYGRPGKVVFSSLRGMTVSQTLNWNAGFNDSDYGVMVQALESKSIEEMLETVAVLGFSGIIVDRYGFNQNAQFNEIKNKIDSISDVEPVINNTGNLFFWNMSEWMEERRDTYDDSYIDELRETLHHYSGVKLKNRTYSPGEDTIFIQEKGVLDGIYQLYLSDVTKEDISIEGFVDSSEGRNYDSPEISEGDNYVIMTYHFPGNISQIRIKIKNKKEKFVSQRLATITSNSKEVLKTDIIDKALLIEDFYNKMDTAKTIRLSALQVIKGEMQSELDNHIISYRIDPRAIFHGPYLDIDKGSYHMTLYGSDLDGTECSFRFMGDAIGGGTEGEVKDLVAIVNSDRIDLRFKLEKYVDDLEVFLKNSHEIEITSATYQEDGNEEETQIDMSLFTFADRYVYPDCDYILKCGDQLVGPGLDCSPGDYEICISGDDLKDSEFECVGEVLPYEITDIELGDKMTKVEFHTDSFINNIQIAMSNNEHNIVLKKYVVKEKRYK